MTPQLHLNKEEGFFVIELMARLGLGAGKHDRTNLLSQ